MEDVEEGTGCATTRFSDTARTMELLRSNMHSMHTCSYYHLSSCTPEYVLAYLECAHLIEPVY